MPATIGRRELIAAFGCAAAWPLAARAQHSPVRPLIGLLSPLSAAAAASNIAAFRSAMRDLGYVEGRNVTLAFRYGEGVPERMAPLARELVALQPDVLFAGSKSGALAVHNATRTIPIVVSTPDDPVASGFANSTAKPGGNVTGLWLLGDDALVGKRLNFLKLAVPGFARLGAIVNPDDPTDRFQIPRLPTSARALDMALEVIEVATRASSTPCLIRSSARTFKGCSSDKVHCSIPRGRKSRPWWLASSCRRCTASASSQTRVV